MRLRCTLRRAANPPSPRAKSVPVSVATFSPAASVQIVSLTITAPLPAPLSNAPIVRVTVRKYRATCARRRPTDLARHEGAESIVLSSIGLLPSSSGEQNDELHRPLPTSGSFRTVTRTIGAFDKGAGKGAVIVNETIWTDAAGEKVATLTGTLFARGDGGFGGPTEGAPQPHAVPDRTPDETVEFTTRQDRRCSTVSMVIATRFMPIPKSRGALALIGRSSTVCVLTALPVARCSRK